MPETNSDFEVPVDETSGKVVDFSDFEHQKENIQPLRRGRSANTLALLYGDKDSAGLNSTHRHSLQPLRLLQPSLSESTEMDGLGVSSHLQEQNTQFQQEIAATDPVESDDPLDVYYRYVQWLLEVFPQAHGHHAIIKLVEKPLQLFRHEERYRNDARFVKMWIWYTSIVGTGQDAVFQFLVANRIGDSQAVFYEEYAKHLEATNSVRKADEVYQLGIARKAQPLARLKRRFDEFQRRVMARTMHGVEPPEELERVERRRGVNDENAQRTMLGTKRSGKSVRSAAANTMPQSLRGLPEHEPVVRPNGRIRVFTDPNGDSASVASGSWRDIGTDESRRKENLPEATSWRGQKLEQSTRRAQVPGTGPNATMHVQPMEKFTVFSDSANDSTAAAQSGESLDAGLLAESGAGAGKPKAKAKDKAKAKPAERMVMPDSILFPNGNGVPQCAEEARAQLSKYRFEPAAAANSDDDIVDESVYDKRVAVNSPTINTRVAQKDMLGIWNNLSDSDSDSDSLLGATSELKSKRNGLSKSANGAASDGSFIDDDYQFTMGPVTPNVVPRGSSTHAPVIPTSARPARFESFVDSSDDNNPPTMVLNSIRAAKRQEMRLARARPTPLAARVPEQDVRLQSIDESSDAADEGESLMRALGPKTPVSARIPVFRDEPSSGNRPLPLFATRSNSLSALPTSTSASDNTTGLKFECDYPPIRPPLITSGRPMHSTPARYPHTPGTSTRTVNYSMSGAELTGLSGFTNMSTIGPGTASTFLAQRDVSGESADDDEDVGGVGHRAQTPMRKRLSMAAKDLGHITPRFPKTPPGSAQQYHFVSDADDDDEDEDEDEDDPCTENIGEFADLDSQMNDLQMQLGAHSSENPPHNKQPMFTIFRD
ncbi:protein kinase [Coemansia sp. RSA 1199]|nr:protein kinase [Coemansia sp. RSA 1199]